MQVPTSLPPTTQEHAPPFGWHFMPAIVLFSQKPLQLQTPSVPVLQFAFMQLAVTCPPVPPGPPAPPVAAEEVAGAPPAPPDPSCIGFLPPPPVAAVVVPWLPPPGPGTSITDLLPQPHAKRTARAYVIDCLVAFMR